MESSQPGLRKETLSQGQGTGSLLLPVTKQPVAGFGPDVSTALEAGMDASLNLKPSFSGVDPQNRNSHQHVSALPDHRPAAGSPPGACQLPKPLPAKVVPRRRRVS